MTRKLLIVFASGALLAVALIAAAWLVGGHRFVGDLQKNDGWNITFDDDDDSAGPRVSKTLTYDGSQPLTLDAPVSLKFVRGTDNRITVEGRKDMVEAVRWDNGRLYLADGHPVVEHTLKITVVAPQVPGMTLKGAGDVQLNGLQQPALAIDLTGAGNIDANGKVDTLTVNASGAGNVDLARVDSRDASVKVSGVGNVELAAIGKVDVTLSGAGNVSLHKKPSTLTTNISGVGSIDRDY